MQVMGFGNTILRIVFEKGGAASKNARKKYEKDNNTDHFNWDITRIETYPNVNFYIPMTI